MADNAWLADAFEKTQGPVPLPSAAGVASGKRSKRSKQSNADDAEVGVSEPAGKRQKTVYTFATKSQAKVSGRRCTCCSATDQDSDPVTPKAPRLWAGYKRAKSSPPDTELETDGATCWYCFRVWNVNFMAEMTLTELKKRLGQDHQLHEKFDRYQHWLISTLVKKAEECPDRDQHHIASWPSPTQLLQMDIYQTVWKRPKKTYMELADYQRMHGDPAAAGKTITIGPGGQQLVCMSEGGVWKKEENIIFQAVKQRKYDDGSDKDTQQFVEDRFKQLAAKTSGGFDTTDTGDGGRAESAAAATLLPPPSAVVKREAPEKPKMELAPFSSEQPQPVVKSEGSVVTRKKAGASGGQAKSAAGAGPPSAQPRSRASGAGAQKGRGRPKRDAATLLRSGLREFSAADASSKFFTSDWKNVCRNWANYMVDLGKMIEDEEDDATLMDLQLLEKQVLATRSVLQKLQQHGVASSESLQCYRAQQHYLSLEPVAPDPFPPYLKKLMHSQDVDEAWPAESFWQRITDKTLSTVLAADDDTGKFQESTVCSKVILITQAEKGDTIEDVQDKLRKLVDVFAKRHTAGCEIEGDQIKSEKVAGLVDDLQVVLCTGDVEDWDALLSRPLCQALAAYPNGRNIINQSKAAAAKKKQKGESLSKLESLMSQKDGTAKDLEEANRIVQHMGLPRDMVADRVSVSTLQHVKNKTVQSFYLKFWGPKDAQPPLDLQSWLGPLQKLIALHGVHQETEGFLDLYKEMVNMIPIVEDIIDIKEAAPASGKAPAPIAEASATSILFHLSSYAVSNPVHLAISEVCGANAAAELQKWHKDILEAELGDLCQQVCKAKVTPLEANAKTNIEQVFKHTTALPSGEELSRLMQFNVNDDLSTALAILRSLPGQGVLALELQMVKLFGAAAKSYAEMRVWFDSKRHRKERKISEEKRQEVSKLRIHIQCLENFFQQKAVQKDLAMMFTTSDRSNPIKAAFHPRQRLGVALDTSCLTQTIATMKEFAAEVVLGWARDAEDLGLLVSSWMVTEWEPHRNDILEKKELMEKMLSNPDYSRCSHGASMLNTWRGWMRSFNTDGGGVIVDASQLKSWQAIVRSACDYCEFTYALHKIVKELPEIKNINNRKAAAKSLDKEMHGRVDLGDSLKARLVALAKHGAVEVGGEGAPAGEQDGLSADGPAAAAVQNEQEPAAKRPRAPRAVRLEDLERPRAPRVVRLEDLERPRAPRVVRLEDLPFGATGGRRQP